MFSLHLPGIVDARGRSQDSDFFAQLTVILNDGQTCDTFDKGFPICATSGDFKKKECFL